MSESGFAGVHVEEYRRRARRVQAIMAERDLDALLCHDFPSICYLTGMESVLLTNTSCGRAARGDPILLSESFELPNALYCCWTRRHVGYELRLGPDRRDAVICCATRGLE